MKNAIILTIFGFCLASCAPTKKIVVEKFKLPLPETCVISWVELADERPKKFQRLGSVAYGESGFTTTAECTEEKLRELIRKDACSVGANAVVITEFKTPDSWGSTCFRIVGDLGTI